MSTLGIDAGGTGTRGVVLSGGVIVHRFTVAPMNLLLHADAIERLAALVAESGAALVGIGLPGLRGEQASDKLARQLSAATGARVVVGNDADAALAGAFGAGDGAEDGDGAVVLAGTGSIALGRRGHTTHRAGGHGFLLGDEGSGWWIGREAVRAALLERDEGRPAGPLTQALTDALQADLDSIVARIYADPRERRVLAGLVPMVTACTDPRATAILTAAADALIGLAHAVREALGAPLLPIAYVGGVFGCDAIRVRFIAATGAVAPAHPPEVAAALMAERAP